MGVSRRTLAAAAAVLLTATACSSTHHAANQTSSAAPAPPMRLVGYDTCQALLKYLRDATAGQVGPYGLKGSGVIMPLRRSVPEPAAADGRPPAYSGTNVQVAGVDEPDMVKTDGRRIVVAAQNKLQIIDAATKKVTGALTLKTAGGNLLLSGDEVLVISPQYYPIPLMRQPPERPQGGPAVTGPHTTITAVDISGAPKVTGTMTVSGSYVDARQVGSVARIVTRSTPRIVFPDQGPKTPAQATEANKQVVMNAPLSDWLPSYILNGQAKQVPCDSVSRPADGTGTSMLSVFSVDLAKGLTDPEPVSVAADGDTVYGSGPHLYIAGPDWHGRPVPIVDNGKTDLHEFDISGSGKPRYLASGQVPGTLLNEYAMSEYKGDLRVATTTSKDSSVYVLATRGPWLTQTGMVGGLGKGERIRAVRFLDSTGYVVTFKQTDPLYTLDLSDSAHPAITGELQLQGYSAYLHPTAQGRLLGVGQDATSQGRVTGAQVQLFDTTTATPRRIAGVQLPGAFAQTEYDPHAFLYWPQSGLTVVPMNGPDAGRALVLQVGQDGIKKVGTVGQPDGGQDVIERSLLIGGTLWTISTQGAQASDAGSLATQAWVPFGS